MVKTVNSLTQPDDNYMYDDDSSPKQNIKLNCLLHEPVLQLQP